MKILSAILILSVATIIGWSTKNSLDLIRSHEEVVLANTQIPQE